MPGRLRSMKTVEIISLVNITLYIIMLGMQSWLWGTNKFECDINNYW